MTSAVVALTGCPPDSPPPQPPQGTSSAPPVTTVPSTDTGSLPPATGSASVEPAPPTTKIPPLLVPDDVNDTAKSHFARLAAAVPKIHAELDGADKLTRDVCSIEDAACDGRWDQIATHLAKARDMTYDLGARCAGTSDGAKRFEKSLAEHRAAIEKRTKAIEARIEAALDSDAKRQKWQVHQGKAAIPRPCLRFRCDDW